MPGFKWHIVVGACSYVLLLSLIGFPETISTAVYWFIWSIAGALFPDVDTTSKGQKIFYRFLFLPLIVLLLQGQWEFFILLALLAFIPFLARHRGIFHRSWFVIIFVGLLYIIGISAFPWLESKMILWNLIFFFIGVISHLLLDGLAKYL